MGNLQGSDPEQKKEKQLTTGTRRRRRERVDGDLGEQVKEAQYALRALRVLPQELQRVHRDRRRDQLEHDQEQERVHDQGLHGDRKSDATICLAVREPRVERVL